MLRPILYIIDVSRAYNRQICLMLKPIPYIECMIEVARAAGVILRNSTWAATSGSHWLDVPFQDVSFDIQVLCIQHMYHKILWGGYPDAARAITKKKRIIADVQLRDVCSTQHVSFRLWSGQDQHHVVEWMAMTIDVGKVHVWGPFQQLQHRNQKTGVSKRWRGKGLSCRRASLNAGRERESFQFEVDWRSWIPAVVFLVRLHDASSASKNLLEILEGFIPVQPATRSVRLFVDVIQGFPVENGNFGTC